LGLFVKDGTHKVFFVEKVLVELRLAGLAGLGQDGGAAR
jgi:hypothetical protein